MKKNLKELDERVKRGIGFLDAKPSFWGWRDRIARDILDLSDPTFCILGQLSDAADFYKECYDRNLTPARAAFFGFALWNEPPGGFTWRELTAAWRRAL